MLTFRRILAWVTLGLLLALAALSLIGGLIGLNGIDSPQTSIIGRFLGRLFHANTATDLFRSPPLIMAWAALAALLLAAVPAYASLRRVGPALMHLGAAGILIGALWGSQTAWDWTSRITCGDYDSRLPRTASLPLSPDEPAAEMYDAAGQSVGHLPFRLRLRDFQINYHQISDRWQMFAILPPHHGEAGMSRVPIDWQPGQAAAIPGTGLSVKVLQYLPHAKPVMTQPHNIQAEPDATSDRPAAHVAVCRDGRELTSRWLVPREGMTWTMMSLANLVPTQPSADDVQRGPLLVLRRPDGPPREYRTDIEVLDDRHIVAQAIIRVNEPMHFAGYHFYQHSVTEDGEPVLYMVSDRGLWLVYGGFILLCLGVLWSQWLAPAIRFLRRRGNTA